MSDFSDCPLLPLKIKLRSFPRNWDQSWSRFSLSAAWTNDARLKLQWHWLFRNKIGEREREYVGISHLSQSTSTTLVWVESFIVSSSSNKSVKVFTCSFWANKNDIKRRSFNLHLLRPLKGPGGSAKQEAAAAPNRSERKDRRSWRSIHSVGGKRQPLEEMNGGFHLQIYPCFSFKGTWSEPNFQTSILMMFHVTSSGVKSKLNLNFQTWNVLLICCVGPGWALF